MDYELTLLPRVGYLHARVVGTRSPQNVLRFLKETHDACVGGGYSAVLLEMNLTGPSLDAGDIYQVISRGSSTGVALQRVAYVEAAIENPDKARFAETVAVNRGVNVRLFADVDSAIRWLSGS
jgi:hypothetical protein